MWHPATILFSWLAYSLLLQYLSPVGVFSCAVVALWLAWKRAPDRAGRLLRRARWLLLSLFFLFLFFTPGEYLPGFWGQLGITIEGVAQAARHLARLLALLASLAWVHELLGTAGLLTGLYTLLPPFRWRERTVVRLLLILDHLEKKSGRDERDWREWLLMGLNSGEMAEERSKTEEGGKATLTLPVPPFRGRDVVVMAASLLLVCFVVITR